MTEAGQIGLPNRLTTGFLDFAELRARNRQETRMVDWVTQTERFLAFNEQSVLHGAGRVSRAAMETLVGARYEVFEAKRRADEAVQAEREADEAMQALQDEVARTRRG